MLKDWYSFQDSAESDALGLTENETLATLQSQIEAALTQLTIVTKRIQEIASENESLKRETSRLRQLLARHPTTQLA